MLSTLHRRYHKHIEKLAQYYSQQGFSKYAKEYASRHAQWIRESTGDRKALFESKISEIIDNHKPLAYILGTQPFYPLPKPLNVSPPCLIPRPETEVWVNELAERIVTADVERVDILDVGSGTGCATLGLAWAAAGKASVLGIDVSQDSLSLCRKNAQLFPTIQHLVRFEKFDIFDDAFVQAHKGQFDIIVSNPPYLTTSEYENSEMNVRLWEDPVALVGQYQNAHGTAYHERLLHVLDTLCKRNVPQNTMVPRLVMELGSGQGGKLRGPGRCITQDDSGLDRLCIVM